MLHLLRSVFYYNTKTKAVALHAMTALGGRGVQTGPYDPLDTIGIVPRAYDMFRAYEGMEGRK
jgi:hypothetical protein